MNYNPLIKAVGLFDQLMDAENEVMVTVVGEEALRKDELFDELYGNVQDLIMESSCSVANLSGRARIARLNLIWGDFLKEHAAQVPALRNGLETTLCSQTQEGNGR